MFTLDTCCTLVPYFEVPSENLQAFKVLGPRFVEKTRTEQGCVHYAFSFSGSTAHCREGYVNAEPMASLNPVFFTLEEGIRWAGEA